MKNEEDFMNTPYYLKNTWNNIPVYDFKDSMKTFLMIPQNKGVNGSITKEFDVEIYDNLRNDMETHISFEKWCIVGAVFGKLGKLWYRCGKKLENMPEWIYIGFDEIFEICFPEYRWEDENYGCKKKWILQFEKILNFLNTHGMRFERNTGKIFGNRKEVVNFEKILENEIICENNKKLGVMVRVRGNALWEFTCKDREVLRVVQIRPHLLKLKKVFPKGGFNHGMQKIYLAWNMLYKNYWTKKGIWKDDLSISTKEMKLAFMDSEIKHSRLINDKLEMLMQTFEEGRIQICNLNKIGSGKWTWEIYNGRSTWKDVISKDRWGNYVDVSEHELTYEMKEEKRKIHEINRVNGKHVVYLGNEHIQTDMSVIYRRDIDMKLYEGKYGRNYSFGNGFQNVKSKDRLNLKIDGESVNEVDFSGLHIRMLYALEGLNYNKSDIYDLGDWYVKHGLDAKTARLAVKKMILIMINAPCRSKAWFAFKKEWNDINGTTGYHKIVWSDELMDLIGNEHKDIKKYFCSGKGVELQWLDGKLMRDICSHFAKKDICALPIHDSLVIQKKYVNEAVRVMENKYMKMFGNMKCPVKIK